MKKNLVLSLLLTGILTTAFPAAAQRLTPKDEALLKGVEKAVASQIPSACINDSCFYNTSEALAYCQGFAQAVTETDSLPSTADLLLKNTLTQCKQVLQTASSGSCLSQTAYESAKKQGRQSWISVLMKGTPAQNAAAAQVDYVDGYRQMGKGIAQGAHEVAEVFNDGYQNMAEGYGAVSYVDGYRQMGKGIAQGAHEVAEVFNDGYQNMAEGYTKVSYVDGYRQMGKGIAQGAHEVAEAFNDGYQNMAEGYTKVSYVDGYRQMWQYIRNFFRHSCQGK